MSKKFIRSFFLTLSLLITFIVSLTWVTLAVENIPNNTTSGTVLRREDKTLTVETDNGVKDYNIPDDIKITKNQSESSLNDITQNDRVTITTGNNGNILSVDAVNNKTIDWKSTYLPYAALILIALGLILALWTRKQKGIIKTKINNFKN